MASAKIIELDDTNTCKLCENALGKYVCPKCNVLYCSLDCYQSEKHSICSEEFYKDSVLNELKLNENDASATEKMMEILKKTHENNLLVDDNLEDFDTEDGEVVDSDDAQDFIDITERLANVDLDDAEKVWEKLTDDERKEFVAFLQSEDVTKLIPQWIPWWSYYNDGKVVDINEIENHKANCPSTEGIEIFRDICKKEPAGSVKYNLINILAGYAFTTRYFNGEYSDFPREVASCIATVSLSLKTHQNFDDFEMAVKSVEQECVNSDWITTDADNIMSMRKDLENILQGPTPLEPVFYILCALSDLHVVLKRGLENKAEKTDSPFAKAFPNAHFPEVKMHAPSKIKLYMKRVEYFLSLAQNFSLM